VEQSKGFVNAITAGQIFRKEKLKLACTMGASCSKVCQSFDPALLDNSSKNKSHSNFGQDGHLLDVHEQKMHKLMKQSLDMYTNQTTLEDLDRDKELVPILSVKIPGITMKSKRSNNDNGDSWCGQYHLLFKHQQKGSAPCGNVNNTSRRNKTSSPDKENAGNRPNIRCQDARYSSEREAIRGNDGRESLLGKQNLSQFNRYPTRLIQRRQTVRPLEEGLSGNHVYAVRWPAETPLDGQEGSEGDDVLENKQLMGQQEQCPRYRKNNGSDRSKQTSTSASMLGQNISTTTINLSSHTKQRIVSNQNKSSSGTDTGAIVAMNTRGSGTLKDNSVKMDTEPSTSVAGGRKSTTITSSVPRVLSLAADIDDPASTTASVDHLFQPSSMCAVPKQKGTYILDAIVFFSITLSKIIH
jgi:hypothetical protein